MTSQYHGLLSLAGGSAASAGSANTGQVNSASPMTDCVLVLTIETF